MIHIMKQNIYTSLQLRELFHLEFLRRFCRKVKAAHYALKGGVNMRFFFQSFRYSEDMDLDIRNIEAGTLKGIVMELLQSDAFQAGLRPFGIEKIVPPDVTKAKQTQTTQRFKVHLITAAGEDLYTKIECSRRGFKGNTVVENVSDRILRGYKLIPLLVSHYDALSMVGQKIDALALRNITQVRDIFDLYILSTQVDWSEVGKRLTPSNNKNLEKSCQNLFDVGYLQFRDSVVIYMSEDDQQIYGSENSWDEIRLRVSHYLEELRK